MENLSYVFKNVRKLVTNEVLEQVITTTLHNPPQHICECDMIDGNNTH